MSLIAPITPTSPPKPVLLGTIQGPHNGKVKYRVGITANLQDGPIKFTELSKLIGTPLFGGSLPVDTQHEHQHIYGTSQDGKGRLYVFHAVVDNAHGGQVAFDIAALSDSAAPAHHLGYAYESHHSDDTSHQSLPLSVLEPGNETNILLISVTGDQEVFNIGRIKELAVEVGSVPMKSESWETKRDGNNIRFSPLRDSRIPNCPHQDLGIEPFGLQPTLTLEAFKPAYHFHSSLVPSFLPPGISFGYVAPSIALPGSGGQVFSR